MSTKYMWRWSIIIKKRFIALQSNRFLARGFWTGFCEFSTYTDCDWFIFFFLSKRWLKNWHKKRRRRRNRINSLHYPSERDLWRFSLKNEIQLIFEIENDFWLPSKKQVNIDRLFMNLTCLTVKTKQTNK